ncbi:acetyl esterase/lipase [Rhodobium orientis]|uniref:Alpha/beta hydrolase n=1 Tax=Rhodobium orientis TaxID=34017 RepID=A0A327JM10_9HYPH|nr:alpha/beta hydrolase [Rhodobium orientis]MBB4304843.1 acetyl esterase/lipase [Rhodobium orientis]MBK5949174.1 alpha/beta hydrolase [Rhodobium orientis]RAI27347.1 alpha/beta hydrolase [Rhodobium orientis]
MIAIDSALFEDTAVSAETRAFNADLLETLSALPDPWQFEPALVRQTRAEGGGPFPLPEKSPRAETVTIPGPGGPIPMRIVAPTGAPRGVYLHFHGGGWTLGTTDQQDDRLLEIADNCGLVVVSVDYRLAPEHPYPAGPDDCEAAALWLVEHAKEFRTDRLTIGGESAGAHLAVVTLLRLRDRRRMTPFCGANLVAGCYDLALTPSVRRWGAGKLVLNTRDIEMFVAHFLSGPARDVADPDISPIHGDLSGLPPALFSVGSRDPLLDDSLFMAQRWASSGNPTALDVAPGGCHVFQAFPIAIARESRKRIDAFLTKAVAGT